MVKLETVENKASSLDIEVTIMRICSLREYIVFQAISGNFLPCSFRTVRRFFYVPQNCEQ